ncbi:MAG: helix-turn-helix domain-containing protein [Alphaproteobacteria bacterium]
MSNPANTKPKAEAPTRTNEQKWTATLMDAGWTVVPDVIIERQQALGLDAIDVNIIMHLAIRWWQPENKPHPSKGTIAAAMGVDARTVQRRIAALEAHGLIRRVERRVSPTGSKSNIYELDGLIKHATPFAKEKIEERKAKEAAAKAKAKKRGPAKLRVVGGDED